MPALLTETIRLIMIRMKTILSSTNIAFDKHVKRGGLERMARRNLRFPRAGRIAHRKRRDAVLYGNSLMARIFYSLCGEGRGHAARVRAMVEHLRHEHEVIIFAPEQAYDFLALRYPPGTPQVEVRRIPGLRFHYTQGKLDLTRSLLGGLGYLWKMHGVIGQLKRAMRKQRPDLVISDFEPALPRAARRIKVPFISLNHQHFLVACDLGTLPKELQTWAARMSMAVRAHHRGQKKTIVSSFFHAKLRDECQNVVQVGPLLRPEVLHTVPSEGEHLVSYLRATTPPGVLEMLQTTGREVRVYGLGERPSQGSLHFHPFHEQRFIDDMASCQALVGAAGNQSLGEAVYLGKPVFALPEEQHHEQLINSHFLRQMGSGDFEMLERVQPSTFHRFLDRLDVYREQLVKFAGRIDGTPKALQEVRDSLALQ